MDNETVVQSTSQISGNNIRPVQILSWNEKDTNWFISNMNYYISRSNYNFGASSGTTRKDLHMLYGVYNNQFPLDWFSHITNPLTAKDEKHRKFPAKIRPVTILRTNIDLLLGEWPRRPYIYNVENLGNTGYSRYMEGMKNVAQTTLTKHFMQEALAHAKESGAQLTPEQLQQLEQDPPVPEDIKAQFQVSYKDQIAIKGQKFLRRQVREQEIKRKQHRMFKDWLIAGECYSYKAIENDTLVYRKKSPLCLDFDKSPDQDFVEDGEWVVCREYFTLSDVVDQFYEDLKEEHQQSLEEAYHYGNAPRFFQYLENRFADNRNRVPVYHVQWKGRKKIGFLSYMDMETFQLVETVVDENYIIDRNKGEQVEWRWVNEVYEGWRIGQDIYTRMRACPVQRNEMNNHSTCKLSYNGRKYSDTHSENISVLEIGIPFQIMYIIVTYLIEKTIAKSKGKILLIDINAIPNDGDWDEEKFFYYADSQGYGLLDRNQQGVDKTWNQYQVVDMSLFDQIKQLIELQDYFKQQWDDIIGINRQRKGQTYSSDGQGVNQMAAFQSTVITDMIFIGFEEFVQRELQGILDLGKFLTAKGVYGLYNDDDLGTQLMEIAPEDFMNEELGVMVESASDAIRKLNEMKQYAQAMLQNDHKPSTVLEIIDAINVSELKAKLRQIEEIDEQIQQMTAQNEQEAETAADERKKDFAQFQSLLKEREINIEFDRKEDIEFIKGSFNTFTFKDGDSNDNGVPDAAEVEKLNLQREQMNKDFENKKQDRSLKYAELDKKERELTHKMKTDKANIKIKQQQVKVAAKKATVARKTKKS